MAYAHESLSRPREASAVKIGRVFKGANKCNYRTSTTTSALGGFRGALGILLEIPTRVISVDGKPLLYRQQYNIFTSEHDD
jgi:hypothetical protein